MDILDDKYLPIDDDIALPWTLQHLMAALELIQNIERPAGSAVEWWKLYERATQDVQNGASMRMAMVSVLGQKPLTSELATAETAENEGPRDIQQEAVNGHEV
jgi:hypothetical protein